MKDDVIRSDQQARRPPMPDKRIEHRESMVDPCTRHSSGQNEGRLDPAQCLFEIRTFLFRYVNKTVSQPRPGFA
nr:hypothetical protein [Falsirhodobacter sp. alg1]